MQWDTGRPMLRLCKYNHVTSLNVTVRFSSVNIGEYFHSGVSINTTSTIVLFSQRAEKISCDISSIDSLCRWLYLLLSLLWIIRLFLNLLSHRRKQKPNCSFNRLIAVLLLSFPSHRHSPQIRFWQDEKRFDGLQMQKKNFPWST